MIRVQSSWNKTYLGGPKEAYPTSLFHAQHILSRQAKSIVYCKRIEQKFTSISIVALHSERKLNRASGFHMFPMNPNFSAFVDLLISQLRRTVVIRQTSSPGTIELGAIITVTVCQAYCGTSSTFRAVFIVFE